MVKIDKDHALFVKGVVIANGIPDSDGDILNKKDIKRLMSSFLSQKVDTNHDFLESFGVKIIENYATRTEEEIGGRPVPIGSWVACLEIWDNEIISKIRQGDLRGLSLASQPNPEVKGDFLNKRNTYSQFKDVEDLTPLFISIVKKPANQYEFDYYSYDTYITKSKKEIDTMSEQNNDITAIANKLLDVVLKDKEQSTEGTVVKAIPPQGGVAQQQPAAAPQQVQTQNTVSLEQVYQGITQILQILSAAQQPMKSEGEEKPAETVEKAEENVEESIDTVEKAEEKTNDETNNHETKEDKTQDTGQRPPEGKDKVAPPSETNHGGTEKPSKSTKQTVVKAQAPQTEHVENIEESTVQKSEKRLQGRPRDVFGRPIRN